MKPGFTTILLSYVFIGGRFSSSFFLKSTNCPRGTRTGILSPFVNVVAFYHLHTVADKIFSALNRCHCGTKFECSGPISLIKTCTQLAVLRLRGVERDVEK